MFIYRNIFHITIKKKIINKINDIYLFLIITNSSIILLLPIIIGALSAKIVTFGWIMVFFPIVTSPIIIASWQTIAPSPIFKFLLNKNFKFSN